jgi:hypothetical protein
MSAWTVIAHTELGGSGATSIEFSSISSGFTDLVLFTSLRSAGSNTEDIYIQFNNDTAANYSFRRLYGDGSSSASDSVASASTAGRVARINGAGTTGSTFSNTAIYIPNYAGSTTKSILADTVDENNATQAFQMIYSTLWSGTAAISSIKLQILTSGINILQTSSATLYGITKGSSGGVTVS